jgi:hypothetical protein
VPGTPAGPTRSRALTASGPCRRRSGPPSRPARGPPSPAPARAAAEGCLLTARLRSRPAGPEREVPSRPGHRWARTAEGASPGRGTAASPTESARMPSPRHRGFTHRERTDAEPATPRLHPPGTHGCRARAAEDCPAGAARPRSRPAGVPTPEARPAQPPARAAADAGRRRRGPPPQPARSPTFRAPARAYAGAALPRVTPIDAARPRSRPACVPVPGTRPRLSPWPDPAGPAGRSVRPPPPTPRPR